MLYLRLHGNGWSGHRRVTLVTEDARPGGSGTCRFANLIRRSELGGDCLILPLISVRRLLPEAMTGHVNEDVLEAGT